MAVNCMLFWCWWEVTFLSSFLMGFLFCFYCTVSDLFYFHIMLVFFKFVMCFLSVGYVIVLCKKNVVVLVLE